jgi:hypothetical protein
MRELCRKMLFCCWLSWVGDGDWNWIRDGRSYRWITTTMEKKVPLGNTQAWFNVHRWMDSYVNQEQSYQ